MRRDRDTGDAEALRLRHTPDLLLVHSMGVDFAGHTAGADAAAYREAARAADGLLARYLPNWLDAGYAALITSDHGMDADRVHYDSTEQTRRVPLWLMGRAWRNLPLPARQTQVAGLMLAALGLAAVEDAPHAGPEESHAAR